MCVGGGGGGGAEAGVSRPKVIIILILELYNSIQLTSSKSLLISYYSYY